MGHRITYTTAPADYDGFGSTSEPAGTMRGTVVRRVSTPAPHLDWQRNRYWSGSLYYVADENDWQESLRLGLAVTL